MLYCDIDLISIKSMGIRLDQRSHCKNHCIDPVKEATNRYLPFYQKHLVSYRSNSVHQGPLYSALDSSTNNATSLDLFSKRI